MLVGLGSSVLPEVVEPWRNWYVGLAWLCRYSLGCVVGVSAQVVVKPVGTASILVSWVDYETSVSMVCWPLY